MQYRPQEAFTTPLILLKPTVTKVDGVRTKTYPAIANGTLFYASFKTFGGTERDVNGVLSIEDTANVETWFNPDITADCVIVLANNNNAKYEIISEPENISMRNQFLKFKIKRIKGGA